VSPRPLHTKSKRHSCHHHSHLNQVKQDLSNGALLVDVREPDEYAAGYAEGAHLLPVGAIQAGTYPTTNKSTKIYLYCRTGRRANQALDAMKTAGYQNVVNIGGLSNWQAIGGAVTKPATISPSGHSPE
jgi:rhodanese-related sulfurtransferase